MKTVKKIATVFLMGTWLMSCQSNGPKNQTVEKAFKASFGDVNAVRWTHNVDYSYAHFDQKGHPVIAVFGNDGQLIETEPAKPGI